MKTSISEAEQLYIKRIKFENTLTDTSNKKEMATIWFPSTHTIPMHAVSALEEVVVPETMGREINELVKFISFSNTLSLSLSSLPPQLQLNQSLSILKNCYLGSSSSKSWRYPPHTHTQTFFEN